jgi:hypothetical protein
MEPILEKIHQIGCKASLWGQKAELLVGDKDFSFDAGDFASVQRLFKSKAPAIRIGNNNHVISDRKAGKLPMVFASCPEYDSNVILIDARRCVIAAQYSAKGTTDKEKKEIHEKMEQLGTDVMNKKI